MITWFIVAAVLCGASLGALFVWRLHRAKQDRVSLRLLTGRSRLLAEEIAHHSSALQNFDQQGLSLLRQQAQQALDHLHLLLVERQAHLLNYGELARLQDRKITRLGATTEPPPPVSPPAESAPPIPPSEPTRPSNPGSESSPPPRDRASIEDQLLSRIGELREPRPARKSPPRT